MKRILLILALLLVAATPAFATDLVVHITDLRSGSGHLRMSVFNSDKTWLKPKLAFQDVAVPAQPGVVTVVFHNLPPGRYGVGVIHDEKDHGGMTFDFFGIPTQGFAFSQNVRPFLSAPGFDSAAVAIGGQSQEISIKMVYP